MHLARTYVGREELLILNANIHTQPANEDPYDYAYFASLIERVNNIWCCVLPCFCLPSNF